MTIGKNTKVFACLKQDAYGCGVGKVASVLAREGVDAFGVVSAADARGVRKAAPRKPILMYPGISPRNMDLVQDLDLTISISGEEDLQRWVSTGARLKAFVKVDLGLWRAGATPSAIGRLLNLCASHSNVTIDGLYSHLSEFGNAGPTAPEQYFRLMPLLGGLKAEGRLPAIVMISSSETVLRHPELDMDAVDPGALLFGLTKQEAAWRTPSIRPALSAIKARIVSIKQCDDSLGLPPALPGYRRNMRVAVLGIGWGHGLPRHLRPSASVLVRERRAPIVPPTHLEHLRIDVTDIPEARLGDEAVLLGGWGSDRITLSEFAKAWDTDESSLSCGLRGSLRRIYANSHLEPNEKKGNKHEGT